LGKTVADADAAMVRLDFSTGIGAVRSFIDTVNGYVTVQEPWKLAKDPDKQDRLATVLYTIAECLRGVAILYAPVMPSAMNDLWASLGADKAIGALAEQSVASSGDWGRSVPGTTITKGSALFPRLEKDS
jgi:methionyl-tRNA synthetase